MRFLTGKTTADTKQGDTPTEGPKLSPVERDLILKWQIREEAKRAGVGCTFGRS